MSDQFAIMPRHLGEKYFSAVNSFYACDWSQKRSKWYLYGQVGTEIVLLIHLLEHKVPFTFIETNAPIARANKPQRWCAIRQTLQIPCLMLSGVGVVEWLPEECDRYYTAPPGTVKRPSPPTSLQRNCVEDFKNVSHEIGVFSREDDVEMEQVLTDLKLSHSQFHVPFSKETSWLTSQGRMPMNIALTRGNHGEASQHLMVVHASPSMSALRELASAVSAVVSDWSNPDQAVSWHANKQTPSKSSSDWKLAAALQRVLRKATYSIET
jgi:hypothetical protein